MPDEPAKAGARVARCLATIRCERADRPPYYAPAIACGVASDVLGRPVHTGTGSLHFAEVAAWWDGETAHADFETKLAEDLVAVHRALDMDVLRMPWRMNRRPDARLDDYTFRFGPESGDHVIWQLQPQTAGFSPIRFPARRPAPDVRLRDEVAAMERVDPMSAARAEIAPVVDLWRRFGGEFLVCGAGAHIGVGLDPDDLELMVTEPDLIRRKTMLQAEFAIAVGRALLEAGCPPVIFGGGDLAGNTGPFYSPAMFRDLVLPAYVRALLELNAMGAHYFFRSDGNIWPLVDMLFSEARCPGYGEADRDASMTVAALRARFPGLVIWGNVSSSLLALGTPEAVRRQAREILEESGGRGCFHGCSNALIHGTPLKNIRALFGG